MKLKRAKVWLHNSSNRDIILGDLDLKIKSGDTVNIFAMRPSLSYDRYLKSKKEGALSLKEKDVIEVDGPRVRERVVRSKTIAIEPLKSRSTSTVNENRASQDFISTLEKDFPHDANLTQEEAWQAERERMMQNLDSLDQGQDGEVFSDNFFDSGDEDLDGFDY